MEGLKVVWRRTDSETLVNLYQDGESQAEKQQQELYSAIYNPRAFVSNRADKSVSAYDREDVTLNCSVDSHIAPEHIEEVSWKKMDEGGDILVLLHLNNETLQGSSDEQYRDRVELFTAEIPKGNLSLRLKSVRPKDKGVYMCHVFAGELSASATAELERKGFSVLHIMVLIVCISASGSALCSAV
ncbi:CD276 antigen homolog [Puntigrus tetrazona]|uniref:CD276 antigen homolog n=1 Tax=Puntigrus tetrazona TaxID=1606681 RepID=UPI001C88F205|nr:CD276 antigen homolog [Puntigrus tetrazona]